MDALLQLQAEVTAKLDYEEYFAKLPVKSYRAHIISAEIDKRLPHLAGKAGKIGCGVLVGMPTIEGIDQNVSTPQSEIILPVDVVELPEINLNSADGTLKSAEEVARAVRAHLHARRIEGLISILYQDKTAISPIEGLEQSHPGCMH